jgi:hypothetical protein
MAIIIYMKQTLKLLHLVNPQLGEEIAIKIIRIEGYTKPQYVVIEE